MDVQFLYQSEEEVKRLLKIPENLNYSKKAIQIRPVTRSETIFLKSVLASVNIRDKGSSWLINLEIPVLV